MAHTTIMRWIHQYGPELNERIRKHLKATKPRSITADGDKAYPVAIRELKKEKCIPHSTPLRVKNI